MHFWANEKLDTLLSGLQAALGHVAVKKAEAK